MQPFVRLNAIAAPLPARNIDTDQIIPARFLKRPRSAGFGDCAFRDLRFDQDGRPRPDFVLNRPPWTEARILVAGANFGCGSSREQAVYALWDFGFRAVVAPSFGDIFHGNALKNGMLPVTLPEAEVEQLQRGLSDEADCRLTVDLEAQEVSGPQGARFGFRMDAFSRECLLKGIDELGYTLTFRAQIEAFENGLREG